MAAATDFRRSDPEVVGSTALSAGDPAPATVEAVIFDLGNVLITWDPHPAIARAVGQERRIRTSLSLPSSHRVREALPRERIYRNPEHLRAVVAAD